MNYKNLSVAGLAFVFFISFASQIIWQIYLYEDSPEESQLNTTTGIILKSRTSNGFALKLDSGGTLTVACGIYFKTCFPDDSDTLMDFFGEGIIDDTITVKWYHHDYIGNLVYEITRNGKKEKTYKNAIDSYKHEIKIIKNGRNSTNIKISLLALAIFLIELFRQRDDSQNT